MKHDLASIPTTTRDKVLRLTLRGRAGIDQAKEAHALLSSALAQAQTLVLDLRRVSGPDLTLLQLLVSTRRTATNQGKQLLITAPGPSPELAVLAAKAGVADRPGEWLGIPLTEHA